MATTYEYSIAADTANGVCNAVSLQNEIGADGNITVAVSSIEIFGDHLHVNMKTDVSVDEETELGVVVGNHQGLSDDVDPPRMEDGRPIVRADTRPQNTQTYFTMVGDDSTSIGGGTSLLWDFSNSDDEYNGDDIPNGYKAKEIILTFLCPVYLKDGTMYFFDAPWGQYAIMDIAVPPGQYYPNPAGAIPASALGLAGDQMYANSGTDIVGYQTYVQKHRMHGDCPMGDELNAEGAAISPIPIGWYLRGRIYTPTSDTISKGYASMEMYRCHSDLLPGMTVADLGH